MLVVTSNWSVADGTLYDGPPPGAVAEFCACLHRAVMRSGFRRDGSYHPAAGVDLVLAGDSFDWLVSGRWTERVRPWHGGRRAAAVLEQVAAGSVRRGGRLLARLSRLARSGFPVPPADRRRRPLLGATQIVPLRVTLLAGDRDPWIEHVGPPATAAYSIAVGSRWSSGRVIVRHGEEVDPLCESGPTSPVGTGRIGMGAAGLPLLCERSPSLSESLAVDLLARFGGSLAERLDRGRHIAPLVRAMATCRPLDMPMLLADRIFGRAGEPLDPPSRRFVTVAWRRAVAGWHREARRVVPCAALEFDGVDHLAACLDRVDEHAGAAAVDGRFRRSGRPLPAVPPEHCGGEGSGPLLTVLGHPPWRIEPSGAASERTRLVCLGPAPERRSDASRWRGRGRAVDVSVIGPGDRQRAWSPRAILVPEVTPDPGDGRGGIRVEGLPWDSLAGAAEWDSVDEGIGAGPVADVRRPLMHRIVDAA